jgi:hypothetical protein
VQGNIEESKKSVVLDLHLREAPYAGVCPDAIRDKSDLEHLFKGQKISKRTTSALTQVPQLEE